MRCNHNQNISKCEACYTKLFKYILDGNYHNQCPCYANAFIIQPNSISTVIRSFSQDEIFSSQQECVVVPLTSICDGSLLKIGDCKSPSGAKGGWCKIVDQANGYITSLQVPKGCCGCYNFDLSASVAMTGTQNYTIGVDQGGVFSFSSFINIPVKATLRLSEQLPREFCVADELADTPQTCFTSVTFPIIDTAQATSTLSETGLGTSLAYIISLIFPVGTNINNLTSEVTNFTSLAVSGTVCLKSCQRLVPTLTLHPINLDELTGIFSELLSLGANILDFEITNIKLSLANLSLKLARIGDCKNSCEACKLYKS